MLTHHQKLWVIVVLNNPCNFARRVNLFSDFVKRMSETKNVNLCIVELAYGSHKHVVDQCDIQDHVRKGSENKIIKLQTNRPMLWQKENLINIGLSQLPADWQYVAWIDADISFAKVDWVEETLKKLQIYQVVQLFSHAVDMGPMDEIMKTATGFAFCYHRLWQKQNTNTQPTKKKIANYSLTNKKLDVYWHPGYAWACTRSAMETIGQLFDKGICGSGDHHFACCMIGEGKHSVPSGISEDYRMHILQLQERCEKLHQSIGYVDGTIFHYWHGKKRDRKYQERWTILKSNKYEPSKDVFYDWQGLLIMCPSKIKLRTDLQQYFQERNEDSVDL